MTAVPYEIEGAARRDVHVNGIDLSVYEAGPADGQAVVLSHGFPELAYSWRAQMPALAAAGYHVIAPDQRGYGGSTRPGPVKDYDIFHLTDDLAELVVAMGHEHAVFVGHDWGGLVVWQMAQLQPRAVDGVVGVNTPFLPRLGQPPTDFFRAIGGEDHYILHFQLPGIADRELAADVAATFGTMLRKGGPGGEPLLDDADLAVYIDEFTRTGFTGGLSWYRNFDRNWIETPEQIGATIDVPAMMITAELDPVLPPALADGMAEHVPDLEVHMIEGCGHWTQQDRPEQLNALLIDWLQRRFPTA